MSSPDLLVCAWDAQHLTIDGRPVVGCIAHWELNADAARSCRRLSVELTDQPNRVDEPACASVVPHIIMFIVSQQASN